MEATRVSEGSADLSCPKCGRSYKRKPMLEKHVSTCVRVVRKAALPLFKSSKVSEALVKVASDLPENVKRMAVRSDKIEKAHTKRPLDVPKSGRGKNKVVTAPTLLEQADKETRWQLIQCNVNEILDETIGTQRCVLTQRLPRSRLTSGIEGVEVNQTVSADSCGWWQAAKCTATSAADKPMVCNDVTASTYRDKAALQSKLHAKFNSLLPTACETALSSPLALENSATSMSLLDIKPQGVPLSLGNMVDNDLFSDIIINTARKELVRAHRLVLSQAYPGITRIFTKGRRVGVAAVTTEFHIFPSTIFDEEVNMFLQSNTEIDLRTVPKQEALVWLTAVYTGDTTRRYEGLTSRSIDLIAQFLKNSTTWKEGVETGLPKERPSSLPKKRPSNENEENSKVINNKTAANPPPFTKLRRGKQAKTCCGPKTRGPKAKYPRLPSPPKHKISPLLSTIGTRDCNTVVGVATDSVAAGAVRVLAGRQTDADDDLLQKNKLRDMDVCVSVNDWRENQGTPCVAVIDSDSDSLLEVDMKALQSHTILNECRAPARMDSDMQAPNVKCRSGNEKVKTERGNQMPAVGDSHNLRSDASEDLFTNSSID